MPAVRLSHTNLVAHNNEPGHDKIYIACVRRTNDGRFAVVGKWGPRGKSRINEQVKETYGDFGSAANAAERLFSVKAGRGYIDIESPSYHGPVSYASVERFLEPEIKTDVPEPEPEQVAKKRGRPRKAVTESTEFEVRCVNAIGVEKHFDLNMTYMAKTTSEENLLQVMDAQGEWIEALRNRFEIMEG